MIHIVRNNKKKYLISFFVIIILAISMELQTILLSYVMGMLIDKITEKEFQLAFEILKVSSFVIVIISIIGVTYKYMVDKVYYKFQKSIKNDVYAYLFQIKMSEYKNMDESKTSKLVSDEIDRCATFMVYHKTRYYVNIMAIILLGFLLIRIHVFISFIIVCIIVINLLINMYIYKYMYTFGKESHSKENELFALESNWFHHIKLIK